MSDHPEFVSMKARHRAEIDELTAAFGAKHAELVGVEQKLRDVAALNALKKRHRADIQEAVARHIALENAWREPAQDVADEEPARFVGNATTLDKPKAD
jgi:hypothetical protein